MKKIIFAFAFTSILWSCKTVNSVSTAATKEQVQVAINLDVITNDQVMVTVNAPSIKTDEITYHIPKTVPGTYSEDNYGRYIEDLKAYDTKGNLLAVKKVDVNSWAISKAKTLDKITYLVNDSFDTEKGTKFGDEDIFSPAGSNIDAGKTLC